MARQMRPHVQSGIQMRAACTSRGWIRGTPEKREDMGENCYREEKSESIGDMLIILATLLQVALCNMYVFCT